jgi:hypothetical protein
MNTTQNAVAQWSELELLHHFEALVARDRRTTAQLLVTIAEIDERKLWAKHACPSMFAFCVERFHMSEQITTKRIWAARTARRFPVILAMVERGELHLSAVHLLARHLTAHNCRDVLQRAWHKSSREIERLAAALAPKPDVASSVRSLPRKVVDAARGEGIAAVAGAAQSEGVTSAAAQREGVTAAAAQSEGVAAAQSESVATTADAGSGGTAASVELLSDLAPAAPASDASGPCAGVSRVGGSVPRPTARPITALSPRRYKIEITVDEDTHDKLRSLQDLLGRSQVGRDPAAIISRAIDTLLLQTLKRKAATTDRPRTACDASVAADESQAVRDAFATTDTPKAASDASATNDPPKAKSDASVTTDPPLVVNDASASTDRQQSAAPTCDASPKKPQPRTRSIPAALRRAVWRRDCGRCRYTDERGRRCSATSSVEFHHKHPFAKGGRHDADNVELRCAAHNQYQADLDFGRDFMDAMRTAGARF